MTRSLSPVMCRRYPLEITLARRPVQAVLRLRRGQLWILLTLLLLGSTTAGQALDSQVSVVTPLADQEPITPIPPPPAADPRKLAIGERLFGDPRLSGDGKLTCSSCHDLRTNGASDDRRTTAHDGSKLFFKTLTVFNAALNFRLNWEGNYRALDAQAESSLQFAPFWPVPPCPHQATKFMSALAAPGNFAKRQVVPVAHWLGSFVPFVEQQVSAQVDPLQSPERQSRPVWHEPPPGCVPVAVERPIQAGSTQ